MGGKPKTVLNIVGFPIKALGPEVLAEILKGAADKTKEAGAIIVGGHSIDDQEPKFGLSVTGYVHPEKFYKNVGSKPGDVLVLTKPIGVGVLTTGIKRNEVTEEQERAVTLAMATLNKQAAELLEEFSPTAVTDVTGFGLLGHSTEMAKGSGVTFEINLSNVPVLDGTYELINKGIVPGGTKANHSWLKDDVEYGDALTFEDEMLLCDAVTSGGLLISLPAEQAKQYVENCKQNGIEAASIIGTVQEKKEKSIYAIK
jgi:selenide, water dikinase